MLAHAAVPSNPASIGDHDRDLDAHPTSMVSHKLKSCDKDTKGTCRVVNCYKERGEVDCKSSKCMCEEGYCAGGSASWDSDTKYCLQTCKEYLRHHPCSDEEVNEPDDTVCGDKTCEKKECCIPKDRCEAGDCNPDTSVQLEGAQLCSGAECQPEECCVPRGKCADFDCPSNTA